MPCVMFAHTSITDKDIEEVFGPFNADEVVLRYDDKNNTMAHIMNMAGVFPSISAARKNGWDKPIPSGYSEFCVGKRKLMVYVQNTWKFDGMDYKEHSLLDMNSFNDQRDQ